MKLQQHIILFSKKLQFSLYIFFLNQKNLTPQKEKEFIQTCERTISTIKKSKIFTYEGTDYSEVILSATIGFPLGISSLVKAQTLRQKIIYYLFKQVFRIRSENLAKSILNDRPSGGIYEIGILNMKTSKPPKNTKEYPIAFVCSMSSFLNSLRELINLTAKKQKRVLVIFPKRAKEWNINFIKEHKNVKIVFIEDYYDTECKKIALLAQDHFKSISTNANLLSKTFRIKGKSIYPYIRAVLKKYLERLMPEIIVFDYIAQKILKEHEVTTLIGGRPKMPVENSFFMSAKNQGIKTISIIHAYHNNMLDTYYDAGQANLVDYMFVPSKHEQKISDLRKPKDCKVLFIGNPQLQKVYDGSIEEKNYKKKLGIGDYILFCAGVNHPLSYIDDVLKVCKKLNMPLVVKIHPRIPIKNYSNLEKKGAIIVDDSKAELYPLMKEARLVITAGSTTTMESILCGTPAIFYERGMRCSTWNHYTFNHFGKLGIPLISKKRDLQQFIEKNMSIPKSTTLTSYAPFLKAYSIKPKDDIVKTIYQYATSGGSK